MERKKKNEAEILAEKLLKKLFSSADDKPGLQIEIRTESRILHRDKTVKTMRRIG